MPKLNYIQSLIPGNPASAMSSFVPSKPANPFATPLNIPKGPQSLLPTTPQQSTVTSNAGATAPKNPVLTTPAAKQYIASQAPTGNTAGVTTPIVPGGNQNPNANYNAGVTPTVAPQGTPVTTPQTPAVNPNASYKTAFDAYIQSLNPSSAETNAQDRLNSLTTQDALDHEKALQSGETLKYSTGLAGQQARTAGIMESGAANTLAAYTGQRTATTAAQKARLDFEQSLLKDAPDTKPFQSGDTTYQYDPTTKTYKSIGTKTPTQPASVQEYQYAKTNGYKGSFTDYQNEDANRKAKATAQPKSLTEAQAKSQGYGLINQLLALKNPAGVPYVDNNGFLTPEGFKSIVQNAAEDGLSRADIISEYGDKIYGPAASKYGLTPKEKTNLGIE